MKNKTEIMKSVNGVTSKAVMKLKKHSPEILVVAGIAGTVVSAVLACKATTKVAEILDETKGTLDTIHDGMETGAINGQEYTTEDGKKDTVVVYAQTGMKLAKLYGPAIILGTLSITSILASNNILRKRNVALGAAYAAIDKSFKEYRGRVIERFGEQVDTELKYGIKAKKFEEIEVDPETGKEKKVKKTVMVADPNLQSDYAVYFDSKSRNYETNPDYNRMFLKAQQAFANADAMAAKLKAAGFDTYITTKSGTAVSASSVKKSTDQIAREVIQGLWGNGADRTNRLKAAGYDPSVIQNRVNQLLK